MTETAFSGRPPSASSDDRNLAFVTYALLFASPFVFGLTALIAVVIAYVRKPEAEPVVASHYRHQIFAFWIAFFLSVLAAVGLMVAVGFLVYENLFSLLSATPADPWEAVAMDVSPRMPAASLVGLIAFATSYGLATLWLIVNVVVGILRLNAGRGFGRAAS